MSQSKLIVETLKQQLRKNRVTYRQVAEKIGLSESSVKRLFADSSFTLDRISEICELLNFEITDLIHEMEKKVDLIDSLTLQQETELVSDLKLMLIAHFLMNKLSFEEIIDIYSISETEGIRLLVKLDRMKIIELLPGNRVKLKISKDFQLNLGGPIEKFYEKFVLQEFFNSTFNGNGESRLFVSGLFSRSANAETIRRMKRLASEANQLMRESEELPLEERFGCSLIIAFRPWEVSVFDEFRRKPDDNKF